MQDYHLSNTEHTAIGIRISLTNAAQQEIGHAYVFFITNDLHDKPYALLENLCVVQNERRKGVGNTLLTEVLKIARERGCYKIIATSRTQREDVHAWYERKGFGKFGYEFRMDLD